MSSSLTPQQFVARWQPATLKERSAYQSHFNDICELVNHKKPVEVDPHGDFFTFEAGAKKLAGEQGFADVWYKGHFAWEYKGKHANLVEAYRQLQQYRESLENPPLLVVSDIDTIEIHTNFTNTASRVYSLTLEDLLVPAKLQILRDLFYHPENLKAPQTTAQVTEEAAARFSQLARILYDYGEAPARIAHFLIRLLFCLFAEDVGLLPANIFTDLARNTRSSPQAFEAQLSQLFSAMAAGGWFGSLEIKHFDGRLFDNSEVLSLDSQAMDILVAVSTLDWGSIEPSIFGTLFERSLDPGKRSQLGAHYTSKEDILLIVEPVLMQPLRRQWQETQEQARQLAARRDEAKGAAKSKLNDQLAGLITGFAQTLAQVQVLDPACGSGNFLYVALRQLLDLWKEVSRLSAELGLPYLTPIYGNSPSPDPTARHRDQRIRPPARPGHDLDRLHPMAARQRFWRPTRADPAAFG